MTTQSEHPFKLNDSVTPVRSLIFGPKKGELCIVTGVAYGRVIISVDRDGRDRSYSLSPSMVRRRSALELLAECADDD